MESWIQRIFLILALFSSPFAFTQDAQEEDSDEATILDAVINPDLERRKIDERKIDSENFELGFFSGVMSIEDFGTSNAFGATFAYHVSEDWFLEATYGASKASKTSFEVLSGSSDLLTDEERELSYYSMSLGLNIFPGEIFLGKNHSFNTNFFVIGGAGNTQFANNEYFTINYGAGFRLFMTDWAALRVGFRNHLFTHSIFGVDKSIQNLEANLGLSLYF